MYIHELLLLLGIVFFLASCKEKNFSKLLARNRFEEYICT